jgi:hypothetical protein
LSLPFCNRLFRHIAERDDARVAHLSIKIDTIEKPDNLHVLAVLEQVRENVKVQL